MPNDLEKLLRDLNMIRDGNKVSVQSEVNGKKHVMISATKVFFNSPKMKFLHPKPSAESRFQNVMELLPQQVFRIKYRIELLVHYNVSATFDVSDLSPYSGESEDEENSRMSFSQAGEDDARALDCNVNFVEYLEF
ncbi:hypothetical protein Tco_1079734 [Tanacetum coccineum]|uniref:Uncharacterized protein n=1 Tax=Tanacetum coccineum TaxID=301880 RepID=A0ABQ5HTL9_9ASTR